MFCVCLCDTQIGRTLVFEALDQAANYRQYVCKTLGGAPADIVTLCGNKLSGRGVIMGSGFKVVAVEQAPCRFGTIPGGQQVRWQREALGEQCRARANCMVGVLWALSTV
jgi:hypothetical protein